MSTETDPTQPATDDQATPPPEEEQAPPEETPETPEDDQDAQVAKLRKENAGHRTRAKEAETRADTAEAQLASVLDHVAISVAGKAGVSPEALAAANVDRGAWFSEDGALDLDRVTADVEDVRRRFALPRRGYNPNTGTGPERQTSATWSGVLQGE